MIWIIASSSWILNLLNLEVIMNYRAGQPLNRIWVRETESIQSFSSENEIKPRSNETEKQIQYNRSLPKTKSNETHIGKIAPLCAANIAGGKTSI